MSCVFSCSISFYGYTRSPPLLRAGRLPNADMGTIGGTIQHVRDIFGRMGFSDREMVALIGAHAVGRCHTEASGEPAAVARPTENDNCSAEHSDTWQFERKIPQRA